MDGESEGRDGGDSGLTALSDRAASLRKPAPPVPRKDFAERTADLLQKAVIAHRGGDLDKAERLYRRVLHRQPRDAIALNDLGILLVQRGQPQPGEELIRKAVAAKPDYAEARSNLGSMLKSKGEIDAAIAEFQAAVAAKPDYVEAHFNLGSMLHSKGEIDAAIAEFQAAVAAKPDYAEAHYSLALSIEKKGNIEEALAACDRAIASKPAYPEAHFFRGYALKKKGDLDKAITAYRKATALNPDFGDAYGNLGIALAEANELDEAAIAYRRALEIKPDNQVAYANLGILLVDKGEVDAAIAHYRRAIALTPDWAQAHFGLALALLLHGDLTEGWREYEWRWKGAVEKVKPRELPKPIWQGEDLAGKTLLLYAEQGLGDTLQFVRFMPSLLARGGRVVLETPGRLLSLLRTSGVAETMMAAGVPLPEFDFHLPMLSLPSVIGLTEETIPADVPYLAADPARVALWHQRLPKGGFRIGVVWQGFPNAAIDKGRSIPLRFFAPIAAVPGVRLISLQKNYGLDQLDALPESMRVETLGAEFDAGPDAFIDTAAVMVNLDLVITSDTSVAHVAGALGRPVWVVLKFNPDWRWLLEREDSPWYPTARLFRQRKPGDWDEVMHRVAAELAQVTAGNTEKLFAPGKMPSADDRADRAKAAFDRGFALHRNGSLDAAAAAYCKAVTLDPGNAEAYSNLGVIRHGHGRIDEAIMLYRRAVAIKPDHVTALGNLAVALTAKGDVDGEVAALRHAVAAKPGDADFQLKLGDALRRKGDTDGAIDVYRQAADIKPDDPKVQFSLAFGLQSKGDLEAAIAGYRQAIALDPSLAQAHANLGVALSDSGRIAEGIAECRQALALRPDNPQYHSNLGLALSKAGDVDAAIEHYRRAVEIDPGYAEGHVNLALALMEKGMVEEAIASGRKALLLKPDYAEAHFNLSLALLLNGELSAGWQEYEWRLKGGIKEYKPQPFKQPTWQGEDLAGKTLLLHTEQGFGDTLQFVRFIPGLAARGGRVVLGAPGRLVSLLRMAGVADILVAAGAPLPAFDFHLSLMSLPSVIGLTKETIPADVPYLVADPARVALWHERLPKGGFRAGVVWQGFPNAGIDKGRSIPLRCFAPIAAVPGVSLISLQKNYGLDQLDALPESMRVETLGAEFDAGPDAFIDTAAVMANLDLVITSDTSIAHMAGALGRPVWIVLKSNPDWRWLLEREDSPWYPTARLFRQRMCGDWEEVMERVAVELAQVTSGNTEKLFAPGKMPPADDRADRAKAAFDRGFALHRNGSLDAAAAAYCKAVTLDPGHAEAYSNIGVIRQGHGRIDEAITLYRRAVAIKPDHVTALGNLAVALTAKGDVDGAIAVSRQAVAAKPGEADVHLKLGDALRNKSDMVGAVAAYRQALALNPNNHNAHMSIGSALRDQGQYEPAIAHYECVLARKPDDAKARLALCMAQMPVLHRDEAEIAVRRAAYERHLRQLSEDFANRRAPPDLAEAVGLYQPFFLPYQGRNDRDLQSLYGALMCRVMGERYSPPPLPPPPRPGEPVRLGIVSGYFREHSNWKIPIKGWISQIDRKRFRLFGYYTGERRDAATEAAAAACERFVQGPLAHERWREMILADAPHVLIYPEVGMDPVAAWLAAQRLAPTQCNAWGHPVTSGFPTLDYYLGSELMEPPDGQDHYTEKLIRLPNLSIYYEPVAVPPVPFSRSELGLREAATVYWCGQSLFKYLPQFDRVFPSIARGATDCQFVFLPFPRGEHVTQLFRNRLDNAFAAFGLKASDYCIFLPYLDQARFLGAIGQCDIVLDSIAWSGCNSTLESLAHDLPIVTLKGSLMRGRHTAAILEMMGVNDTVADTVDNYIANAIRLARDVAWRKLLRERISERKHRLYRDRTCISALEDFLDREARARPDDDRLDRAKAAFDRGFALQREGSLEAAAAAYCEAVSLDPNHAEAYSNLGIIRHVHGRIDEAITLFRRAVTIKPDHLAALGNLAVALTDKGDVEGTIEGYRRLVELDPHNFQYHFNLLHSLLLKGDYTQGWREWEWVMKRSQPRFPSFSQPLWAGEETGGRVLLLAHEQEEGQGYGDTLFFCRYATLAAAKARVVLAAPRPLVRLLGSLGGVERVVSDGDPLPPFDLYCPLLSLPRALMETMPAKVPYLAADAAQVASWKRRLESLPGLRVGLVWAGKLLPNQRRSMTLAHFGTLAKLPGISLVSLQKGAPALEARSPPPGLVLHDWTDELDDFADTAALIEALDLVISVDTSVAHLAGVLGRPVWIMLKSNPDWRWQLDREDSPWYPTARLFRQHARDDWDEVMQRVAAELAQVAAGNTAKLFAPIQAPPADDQADRARAAFERAFAMHRDGVLAEAAALYSTVIALDPNHAEAHSNLGVIRHGSGRIDEAITLYRRAVAIKPDHVSALGNLAVALTAKGDVDGAIDALQQAVAAKPEYAEGHFNLALDFEKKGDTDAALAAFDRAVASRPDYPEAQFGRANALKTKGRIEEAIAAYREATALKPDYAAAHAKLGLALAQAGELDEAIAAFRRVLALRPDNAEAHANVGHMLVDKGEVGTAIAHYRRAIALAPDWPQGHFGLALALLLNGDLTEGWREYEWRWKGAVEKVKPRELSKPIWQGEDLAGKTLLLYAEQGLGDTLQFVRFMPSLLARGGRVILETPGQLLSLLRTSGVAETMVAAGTPSPEFDVHLPLLSLPSVIGLTEETIPAEVPYLAADPARVALWHGRLPKGGFRVGIVWQGRPDVNIDKGRSIPLRLFAPVAGVPGVRLISLQKNYGLDQLDALPESMRVETLGAEFDAGPDAFIDTAAVMANLDLVITSDTSVVHVAGALGRPVWVVLKSNPDWRWLRAREDSPWYPTARLFRQRVRGDWEEVMERVAAELAQVTAGNTEKLFAPGKMSSADDRANRRKIAFDGGFALHRNGSLDAAAVAYCKAVTLDPGHAEAYSNLGVIRHGHGRIDEAIMLYRRAAAIKPDHVTALANLAVALTAKGDIDGAIAALRQVVAAKPDDAEGHLRLGDLFRRKGEMDGAVAAYRQAVAAKPDDPKAHFGLAQAWQTKGDLDAAIASYRRIIALDPSLAQAHANLGVALGEADRVEESIVECRRALVLEPDIPQFHANLAVCLQNKGDLDGAIEGYRRAIALEPRLSGAHANLGLALLGKRQIAEAISACRRAVEIEPDNANYHFNLSQPLLLKGDFTEGWQEYEWRLKTGQPAFTSFSQPVWAGEEAGGRVLLLVHEQGFGDTLQFCRYATFAAAKGRVVLAVPRPLVRLLGSLKGVERVISEGEKLPRFDLYSPLASLPHAFNTTIETIPANVPYLAADPEQVASWKRRLAGLPGLAGLRVGLVWAGNPRPNLPPANAIDRRRSIALAHFGMLAELPGVSFISLQKGDRALQARSPPPGLVVHDWTDELDDFADTAALIEALDLVISVDTSVVHLAGALGKPVWILSRFDGCWRWLSDRDDSPWYPTARLFRQRKPGDWNEVMQRVAVELAQAAAGNTDKLFAPGKTPPAGDRLDRARAAFDRGFAVHQEGSLDAAAVAYCEAITLDPNHAEAHSNLGVIRHGSGRCDEAITLFRRAVAIKPDYVSALGNLAVALTTKGDVLSENSMVEEAIVAYRRAITLKPEMAEAHVNLGFALRDADRIAEGIAECRRGVELDPDNAQFHFNLSNLLLLKGDFTEGWQEYEWRLKTNEVMLPSFSQPVWGGEETGGRVLLLVHEQGFGDTLQFCRFATLAAAKGRVVLAAPRPLARLLASLEGVERVVSDSDPLPPFDLYCPLASLPRVFNTTIDTIPAKVPYLAADALQVASWKRRLEGLPGLPGLPGLRVGLVWAGNPRPDYPDLNAIDRRRSIALAHFAMLADLPGVSFISLQKGAPASQARSPPPGLVVHDWTDELDDFADTAALIEALDLVISVDTSIVHLAGALGKPVWILSRFDGCWRWLSDRDDSPWYPTARLFRQRKPGDWNEVMNRVAAALAQVAAGDAEQLMPERSAGARRETIAEVPSIVPAVEPVLVPIAVGELADKTTILEIKAERITDAAKLRNVRSELDQLRAVWDRRGPHPASLEALTRELKMVNERLWDIEDEIRDCERAQDFGPQFVALARAVYRTNDRRAEIKREINLSAGSNIIEEKSYRDYRSEAVEVAAGANQAPTPRGADSGQGPVTGPNGCGVRRKTPVPSAGA